MNNFLCFFLQSYHVAYVIIKAANSPRPGLWVLEKSNDGGKTFEPWHYFAPTPSDCYTIFGVTPLQGRTLARDDQVACSSEYAQVPPLQNGEVSRIIHDALQSEHFQMHPNAHAHSHNAISCSQLLSNSLIRELSLLFHDNSTKNDTNRIV